MDVPILIESGRVVKSIPKVESGDGSILFMSGFGEVRNGRGGYGRFTQLLANETGKSVLSVEPHYQGVWPSRTSEIRQMLSERVSNIYDELTTLGYEIEVGVGHSHGAQQICDSRIPVGCVGLINPSLFAQSELQLHIGFLREGVRKIFHRELKGLAGYSIGLLSHLGNAANALRAAPVIAQGINCQSLSERTAVFISKDDKIFSESKNLKAIKDISKNIKVVQIPGGHTGILDFPDLVVKLIAAELFST